ncbi:MAG TPA: TlpA disulfide reductase family protein [Candidatus Acidoferrales bacterium]|nr:TlpA disulfide reductase family protein [Candidatus Acidoferrales bacterium]
MEHKVKRGGFLEEHFHLIVIGVIALVAGAVYLGESSSSNSASATNLPKQSATVGTNREIAPDFTLTSIDGKTIKLSDYRGKVVILDFWATWCAPCKAEIPDFIKLSSQYKSHDFQMLGVSLDEGGLKEVAPFMKQLGMNYPVVLGTEEVVSAYGGIRGIPTTFVIDKNGFVRAVFEGYRDATVFENLVKQLLFESMSSEDRK